MPLLEGAKTHEGRAGPRYHRGHAMPGAGLGGAWRGANSTARGARA